MALMEDDADLHPTRRKFLALGPAAVAAMTVLGMNEESSAQAASTPFDPQIPFSSARRYKIITLPNKLKVLLVSDKRAFRSSAALSVGGAGQFADPYDVKGLAHLMEHMVLSYNSKSTFRQSRDFEDWLSDQEGASNAFTAYDSVCFHFSCPEVALSEALERFAGLFLQQDVERICRDAEALKREIRRVDSELDFDDMFTQSLCLTQDFVNPEHPYATFSRGNLDTLERGPQEAGIDVGSRLIAFFRAKYQPSETVLVVQGPQDLVALERWVAPFGNTLSRDVPKAGTTLAMRSYPGGFLQGNRLKQMILYRKQGDSTTEKLSFDWVLDLDYVDIPSGKQTVTATQIAFVLAQILGRRGPGSLYLFLLRRGWVPSLASSLPRITIPIDVSGFQIIKLDINLTLEGFAKRSAVVAAVYDSIEALRNRGTLSLSRGQIAQYATIAKLHGYVLTPRPPDAVELALDAQLYGLGGRDGVGSGAWYRFPSAEDRGGFAPLQQAVSTTLKMMSDPERAVIIATAGNEALGKGKSGIFGEPLPLLSSERWLTEPTTGARFCFDDMLGVTSRVENLVLTKLVDRYELQPPVLNPLVPATLRPARHVTRPSDKENANESVLYRTARDTKRDNAPILRVQAIPIHDDNENWTVLDAFSGQVGLSLPRSPPESSCRCAFVLQLLSSRPARADVRQAAKAELWKVAFEMAVMDLAELGAPGGLAYDLSFNKFGMRITVLGVSQNLPSYCRRLCRRLVEHPFRLLEGPETLSYSVTDTAIAGANRATGVTLQRKRRIISNLRRSTAYETAAEGIAFLRSCTGAVCFAEGDLLRKEVYELRDDLKGIFSQSVGSTGRPLQTATPAIDDLLYKPFWKPRSASPCSISGVPLMSDACGRLPR
jgi:insulysin